MGIAPSTILTAGPTVAYSTGTGPASKDDLANAVRAIVTWAQQNAGAVVSGPTTARPTASQLNHLMGGGVGYMYFDTTLGLPVWWTGAAWHNAAGAVA